MKKIIVVVLSLLTVLIVGSIFEISKIVYISSIHFSAQDELSATFFSPSPFAVGKAQSDDSSSTYITVKGESIEDVFNSVEHSLEVEINYRHIVSVIFDESFIEEKYITSFNKFIYTNRRMDFNFYIFSSNEKPDDLFSFKNPDNISSYHSILNVNSKSLYLFQYIKPLHYINFLKASSSLDNTIKIPYLSIGHDYQANDKEAKYIYLNGILFHSKKNELVTKEDAPNLLFLNEFNYGRYYLEDYNIVIQEISNKIKVSNKCVIKVKIYYEATTPIDEDRLSEKLLEKIDINYQYLIDKGIDYFNIADINKKYKKNYNLNDVVFDVCVKKV